MTPNPTARPFIVGALLFLTLVGFWPGRARAARHPGTRDAAVSTHATSPLYR
jgi:hypothetical protein